MEKSSNIEDQVMDNLLRSYIRQQRPPEENCQGFDADLASLYLERVLTEKETSRYEIHLSNCSPCRSSVIALARFAEEEIPLAISAPVTDQQTIQATIESEQKTVGESSANWSARLQAFLHIFATPRYALAAVAVLALAISLPFVISQKDNNALNSSDQTSSAAEARQSDAPSQIAQAPLTKPSDSSTDDENRQRAAYDSRSNSSEAGAVSNPSLHREGAGTTAASGGAVAATPAAEVATAKETKKEETKSDAEAVADNKSRSDDTAGAGRASEPTAARAAAPPATDSAKVAANERKELPRIDPKDTLRPPDNDKVAAAKTIKPGASDGTVATANQPKKATIRPGDASAQPPAPPAEFSRRKGVVATNKSLRDESDVAKERARASASRKIDNKTFWLLDDVWTDKDYRKDKELPVVTLIKDSDVYQEVLEKRSSLQKFFKGFAANEKVIVVYKGTVYRLIPRDGN